MGIYSEIMEGSLGKNRVGRVYKSKNIPIKQSLPKVVNLTTKRALRGGADPKDVASRMTNPSANLRSVQGLQRFQDQARLKRKFPSLRSEEVQLDELSLVKKALVKVRKSMRGNGVVGTAALAASNVAPNSWGGVSDADNEHRRKYGAKMRLRRKAAANGVKVQEAAVSKANKVYRKFGHGPEYNLASLKSSIDTLRRGGASDETIKSYPAIHAQGGYHNKAEITTARSNFMARGMRKQNASPSWRAKIAKNANPSMTAEGVQRAVRLMNKVLKKNRPVTDTTVATKAYADFIGMNKRQAAKQQRRGGAPESVMKKMTPSAINTRIAAMRNFTETGRAKREAALKAKGKV